MKLLGLVSRRSLFFRLYVYEVAVVALVFLALASSWHTFIDHGEGRTDKALLYLGEWALRQSDLPERLQREFDVLGKRLDLRAAVYTADGRLVATTGAPLESSIDASLLQTLMKQGTVQLPGGGIAVTSSGQTNPPAAYAIVALPPAVTARAEKLVRVTLLALVLFALATVPFVQSIAKPLGTLADAAKAFGAGNLSARANLQRRDEIGDVARSFNEMADNVEAFRRAEKELLANVSHELRTPLARIRVVLELAAKKPPEATRGYIAAIDEDLRELERLIDNIIATARLEIENPRTGDPYPPLRLGLTHIGSFVEALVKRATDVHPERSIKCEVDHELIVLADRLMLKHAITNVLENAHKYSPPDRPIAVSVTADSDGESALVEIRDQGMGIEPADIPQVFTPFFRADRSRAKETGGVGLGLSLAQRIVRAHGGSIRLSSALNTGTTVTISLPLDGGEEALS